MTDGGPVAAINLESIGARPQLGYAPDEGFQMRRYASAPQVIELVRSTSRQRFGDDVLPNPLPAGVLTDGRSFLAHGVAAVTLVDSLAEGFPRRLHSIHDSRDRLSVPMLERTVSLLEAVVAASDADPSLLSRPRR